MVEVLGGNLSKYFENDNKEDAFCTYKGERYEVWEVCDALFAYMCDQVEDDFYKEAGTEEAWWRCADGSNIKYGLDKVQINGHEIAVWNKTKGIYAEPNSYPPDESYKSLTSYLSTYIGASNAKNVCALSIDLAKYNGMKLADLYSVYEGKNTIEIMQEEKTN